MSAKQTYEQTAWLGDRLVLGIDEAGRGPLAGELVVCGVVLEPYQVHPDLDDSKKLSEKKRLQLYDWTMEHALAIFVEMVSVEVIDQMNIYQATKQAMEKIARMVQEDTLVLSDAMKLSVNEHEVIPLIKGDHESVSIAAASIMAKTIRDRRMKELDQLYPDYAFAKHKGYPTKQHYEAIEQYGITPYHRKSYRLYKKG